MSLALAGLCVGAPSVSVFATEQKSEPLQAYGRRSRVYTARPRKQQKGTFMHMALTIGPLVSLIAGILILVMPRLLNYIVAIYLIVMGLIGLFGSGNIHL
jgi:hypothetical protein